MRGGVHLTAPLFLLWSSVLVSFVVGRSLLFSQWLLIFVIWNNNFVLGTILFPVIGFFLSTILEDSISANLTLYMVLEAFTS